MAATPDTPTLRDHLLSQLSLTNLDERDRGFVVVLIGALDEDGYLTQPLEEIAALLPAELEAGMEELTIALRHLQHFEPAGVGARSPGECLCLQLRTLEDDPARKLALDIAEKHLDLLASRDYTRLKSATGAGEDALRAAQRLIQTLNPRPGASFARVEARYVIPDVIVRKVRYKWSASINPASLPRVRLNRAYAEAISNRGQSNQSLSRQLQEARWLLRSIEQRFATIQRVADAIVARQRGFFEYGDVAMKPLTLKLIAG